MVLVFTIAERWLYSYLKRNQQDNYFRIINFVYEKNFFSSQSHPTAAAALFIMASFPLKPPAAPLHWLQRTPFLPGGHRREDRGEGRGDRIALCLVQHCMSHCLRLYNWYTLTCLQKAFRSWMLNYISCRDAKAGELCLENGNKCNFCKLHSVISSNSLQRLALMC